MDDFIDVTELDSIPLTGGGNNFGGGMELLMNHGGSSLANNHTIKLAEIDDLEREMNESAEQAPASMQYGAAKSSFFGGGGGSSGGNSSSATSSSSHVKFSDDKPSTSSFFGGFGGSGSSGDHSASTAPTDHGVAGKTWDGYQKYTNIPTENRYTIPQKSPEEQLKEKYKILLKIKKFEKRGVHPSKTYTTDSQIHEMRAELEAMEDDDKRTAAVNFQAMCLKTVVHGLEMLNTNADDPLDLCIDGIADKVSEDMDEYNDIFEEIYEDYKDVIAVNPIMKGIFKFGMSAAMLSATNRLIKNNMPGMDEIFRANPGLEQDFQKATANAIGQNIRNGGGGSGMPTPMATRPMPPMSAQAGSNYSRSPYEDVYREHAPPPPQPQTFYPSAGVSAQNKPMQMPPAHQSYTQSYNQNHRAPSQRAEMKGPSDISNIISGIKTKPMPIPGYSAAGGAGNDDSTVGVDDLKAGHGGKLPKRSERRRKNTSGSASNHSNGGSVGAGGGGSTISLDF